MRFPSPVLPLVLLACFASVILSACPHGSETWYPKGCAAVASWRELVDGGGKVCLVTLKVENSGSSTINAATVSLAAETGLRTYLTTAYEEFVILPGRLAYFEVEIRYASEDESLLADGLSIVDEYYR